MKRIWKPLLPASKWVLLSAATSILIILTQATLPLLAQEPAASTTIETTKPSSETTKIQKLREVLQRSSTPEAPKPTPEVSEPKKPESPAEPPLTPEELSRQLKFIEADRLYLAGQIPEAEKIYREVKQPFGKTSDNQQRKAAILDPTQLSPGGKVYWRESEAGIAQKLQTKTLVPLQLLARSAEAPHSLLGVWDECAGVGRYSN
nr:hypothetical protein [Nostoc sphaeroides]